MSWLIPSALGIAAAAAVGILALHFIARSRPLAEPLPTARFVPDRPVHARTRSTALTDLLLLLMRVAAVLAVGAAVAGPIFEGGGRVVRLIVLDRSRAVASVGEARDSVRSLARVGDVVIVFDSAAVRLAGAGALDSIVAVSARGSLSAALAAAARIGVRASAAADSIELVVVSPLVREELDEATTRVRDAWPGRIRVVPIGAASEPQTRQTIELPRSANDAIIDGLSLTGMSAPAGAVRLVRGKPTSADSAWARDDGHVLLHWPASDADADWPRRSAIDAIGGVTAGGATLVARFPRLWSLDGSTVARWADGEPAAVEHATGRGCIRDVGVVVDQSGDLTLRAPFRRFAAALLAPCGGARDLEPIDASARASLRGDGPLAPASALRDRATASSPWAPWLLAGGALLLLGELAVRRGGRVVA